MSGTEKGAPSALVLNTEAPTREAVSRIELFVPTSHVDEIRWLAASLRDKSPVSSLVMGDFLIDLAGHEASCRGVAVRLTYREFALLSFLAIHPGQVFTREELLAALWDNAELVSTRTVDIHILRLRNKLGPAARRMLVTVRNVGYKLVAPRSHAALQQENERDEIPRAPKDQLSSPRSDGVEGVDPGYAE